MYTDLYSPANMVFAVLPGYICFRPIVEDNYFLLGGIITIFLFIIILIGKTLKSVSEFKKGRLMGELKDCFKKNWVDIASYLIVAIAIVSMLINTYLFWIYYGFFVAIPYFIFHFIICKPVVEYYIF